jgi:hypothetical protein
MKTVSLFKGTPRTGEPSLVLADGVNDRRKNVLIVATSANVFAHRFDYLLSACRRSLLDESNRGHDVAGNAVTALHGLVIQECLLDGMQLFVSRDSLDGLYRLPFALADRGDTGARGDAVNEDRASATFSFAAPILGAGQSEILTKNIKQGSIRVRLGRPLTAVDSQHQFSRHHRFPQG